MLMLMHDKDYFVLVLIYHTKLIIYFLQILLINLLISV